MDPAIIDLISKLILLALAIIIGVIGFFVRNLISDHRRLSDQVGELRIDVSKADSTAHDAEADLVRLENKIERRFRDVAERQDKIDGTLTRMSGDIAALLSAAQHQSESQSRTEAKVDDIGQRISRLEGKGDT